MNSIEDACAFVKRLKECVGRDKLRAIMKIVRSKNTMDLHTIIISVANLLCDESEGSNLMITFSSFFDAKYRDLALHCANEMMTIYQEDNENDPEIKEIAQILLQIKFSNLYDI